ncbi:hypothetical protein N9O82_01830 [Methylophilaceae bacterium]|nr:hypothetical protein [Methylophilaceae bacterium]
MAAFLLLLPYYLWTVNGSTIYATMNKTSIQDLIILFYRTSLIIFALLIYYLIIPHDFTTFIYIYSFIILTGTVVEIFFLDNPFKQKLRFNNIVQYINLSKSLHVDYIAFNVYQLVLMIFSASMIELKELGKLNFLIQIMNFLFILSIVGSIRVKKYVAHEGFVSNFRKIKLLYFFSIFTSTILAALIFFILKSSFFIDYFSNFGNLSNFFLITCFSIPGYFTYQFIYPFLIEYNFINLSMKINLLIFMIMALITFPVIKVYGFYGSAMLFSTFYLLILIGQIYIWKKISIIFK